MPCLVKLISSPKNSGLLRSTVEPNLLVPAHLRLCVKWLYRAWQRTPIGSPCWFFFNARKVFHVYILSCVSVTVQISYAILHVGVHLQPSKWKVYL
jgi:hypothetical protein